jgi:hypothetical protein
LPAGAGLIDDQTGTEAYWAEIREIARQTDPELALAHHLDRERQRLYRWYPYDESWRQSRPYNDACQEFERKVMDALAREVATGRAEEEGL